MFKKFFKRKKKKQIVDYRELCSSFHIGTLLALVELENYKNAETDMERAVCVDKAKRFLVSVHDNYISVMDSSRNNNEE